ncbi:hypothetical protein D3C73_1232010 [compost metagenome]
MDYIDGNPCIHRPSRISRVTDGEPQRSGQTDQEQSSAHISEIDMCQRNQRSGNMQRCRNRIGEQKQDNADRKAQHHACGNPHNRDGAGILLPS